MTDLQTVLAFSEMKSLRAVVGGLYALAPGGPPLYLGGRARAVGATRPFWRVDVSAPAGLRRVASGWDDGDRGYVLGYYGSTYPDVEEKIGRVRSALSVGVPFLAYDASWFSPYVEALPASGSPNLPSGTYTISVSLVNTDVVPEEETLCSHPKSLTLASPGRIAVYTPSWPWQSPLQGKVRVYVGSGTNARRLFQTGADVQPVRGWSLLTVNDMPDPAAAIEPDDSTFRMGFLHVGSLSQTIYENPDLDGEVDGVLSLGLTRALQLPHSDTRKTFTDLVVATSPDPAAGVGGITSSAA